MVSSHKFSVMPLQRIMQRLMRMCRPLCMAIPLWAASTGLASAESWKVNLQDADIKAFINEVATITNARGSQLAQSRDLFRGIS